MQPKQRPALSVHSRAHHQIKIIYRFNSGMGEPYDWAATQHALGHDHFIIIENVLALNVRHTIRKGIKSC